MLWIWDSGLWLVWTVIGLNLKQIGSLTWSIETMLLLDKQIASPSFVSFSLKWRSYKIISKDYVKLNESM